MPTAGHAMLGNNLGVAADPAEFLSRFEKRLYSEVVDGGLARKVGSRPGLTSLQQACRALRERAFLEHWRLLRRRQQIAPTVDLDAVREVPTPDAADTQLHDAAVKALCTRIERVVEGFDAVDRAVFELVFECGLNGQAAIDGDPERGIAGLKQRFDRDWLPQDVYDRVRGLRSQLKDFRDEYEDLA